MTTTNHSLKSNYSMKFKQLTIDFSNVNSLDDLHDLLSYAFQFPDFYGKNIHALIDCLSSLPYPEHEMSGFTLDSDEVLLIETVGLSKMNLTCLSHFLTAIEFVNQRKISRNLEKMIYLSLL